jgi:hypothetical protein
MTLLDVIRVVSLRRDGSSPAFLDGDRAPGTYREFFERWGLYDDGSRIILRITSPNVGDPDPQHGFYETGRRFELFDAVPSLFLEDLDIRPLTGMLHVDDHAAATVYRFRQV